MSGTETTPRRAVNRLKAVRARVRRSRSGRITWRVGATTLGVVVILVGIVLLPLPGPGWLIIFAGLGILATEYAWAAGLLRFAREQVGRWTNWVRQQNRAVQIAIGTLGLALLVAVAALAYWVYS
jgi:uncharacterized protein (TIGR02611 family)